MNVANDDADLLRRFAEKGDQDCFRQLLHKRIGFVYAVTLRRLRDPHLAQEATQAVFVALARKAEKVAHCPSVMGWLHRSSCYESRNLVRAQTNRVARESEALRLGTAGGDVPIMPQSPDVETVLDEVLSELPEGDRDAILARYFSSQSYAQIGAAMGRTENAARMRVERALSKLRDQLERRGFDSAAAVLMLSLPGFASAAVPAGVVSTVTQAALSGLVSVGLPATFFAVMNMTKITTTIVALAALGATAFGVHKLTTLESELQRVREENGKATQAVRTLEDQVKALQARPVPPSLPVPSGTAIAPAVAATVEEPEVPGITRKAPIGWSKNGSNPAAYDVGVDQFETWGGMPSAYVKSKASAPEGGFAGMMQTTSAEAFKNQRVRLTGCVKTVEAKNGGHLWLRVDGSGKSGSLGYDDMNSRAPKGTTDWQEFSLVLDVPDHASSLNYGFFVQGTGKMWVNGLTIQPVGSDVPSTNISSAGQLPKAPVNLGFAPK